LCGPERSRSIVVWRQAAHWLCKELTSLSLPAIGRAVNRDHTSVLNSIRRIEKKMQDDKGIKQYLTILRNDLAVRFKHD
jgi:chromosomal replication initiator protein